MCVGSVLICVILQEISEDTDGREREGRQEATCLGVGRQQPRLAEFGSFQGQAGGRSQRLHHERRDDRHDEGSDSRPGG